MKRLLFVSLLLTGCASTTTRTGGRATARVDWRALCTTGGFDCQGMHSGWPIP